jgi:hypothetical protein
MIYDGHISENETYAIGVQGPYVALGLKIKDFCRLAVIDADGYLGKDEYPRLIVCRSE